MTNPNTGSTPYGQDPNSYSPQTGPQSYPQTGGQQYPQTGGQQYGAPQQYGQPQYGQPQYGAPQQYGQPGMPPMQPYAGGYAPQNKRPGMATAAGVLGIIFGTIGFLYSAYVLVVLTGASESGVFSAVSDDDTIVLVLAFISTAGVLVASVMVFVGAIQILSGKNNKIIVLSCVIYIASQIIGIIGVMIASGGDGIATTLVGLIISLLLAGMLIFFAKNSDVERWISGKRAAEAAGYAG